MSIAINISNDIAQAAKTYSSFYKRSMAKQIEFWTRIGKIAEENPEMNYEDIKGILISLEEKKAGLIEGYKFD